MIQLPKILPIPEETPNGLLKEIKWLSGEGAGSWFLIEESDTKNCYKISRFSQEGFIECQGLFIANDHIDLNKEYSITYPSHCAKVTLLQYDKIITLQK